MTSSGRIIGSLLALDLKVQTIGTQTEVFRENLFNVFSPSPQAMVAEHGMVTC